MKSYFNIAICDDDILQLKINENYVLKWAHLNKLEIKISRFTSAKECLFEFHQESPIDLIILDIQLADLNGIELAKAIRDRNKLVKIIFITGHVNYALEGYKVQALDYLIKPIDKKDLFQCLDNFLLKSPISEQHFLCVEKGAKLYRFFYDEINYFTSFDHYIDMYTNQQVFTFRGKISDLEKKLNDSVFYRCHRSYIVNLKSIKKITKTNLILKDGTQIPISRGRYKKTYEAALNSFNIIST